MGLMNILTFGAQGRIERANDRYNSVLENLKQCNEQQEQRKAQVNSVLQDVVECKKDAVLLLNRIQQITQHLKVKERQTVNQQIGAERMNFDLDYVEATLDGANLALAGMKGAGAGIASGSAAMFLVGNFAAASTGTAISTLSGAAATNATLAWLGGGSIAAGGGGIAAGTLALGGIIAIPALAVMGIFSNLAADKKIHEIKKYELDAIRTIDAIKKNILAMDLIEQRVKELNAALLKERDVFDIEFRKVNRAIYPIPGLSRFWKNIRKKVFRKNYFSEKDVAQIAYIGKLATNFAQLIDTKVLETNNEN